MLPMGNLQFLDHRLVGEWWAPTGDLEGMVTAPLLFAALLLLTIIGVIFFLIEPWHISQRSRRRWVLASAS